MNITRNEYIEEIEGIAANIACEAVQSVKVDNPDIEQDEIKESAQELINDSLLHETIDGHEWIIYTAYHLPILQYSPNDDYMVENLGGAEEVLKQSGIGGLHQALAFWAMYADVQDELDSALDDEIEGED